MSLAAAAAALGGKAKGNTIRCPGPGHSRNDRSLEVTFNADGSFVVRSFAGDDWRDCKDYVRRVLGIAGDKPPSRETMPPVKLRKTTRAASEAILRRWARCVPIAGTPAETYLRNRGLSYAGDALRYCDRQNAMAALITHAVTGAAMSIQWTLLDEHACQIRRLFIKDKPTLDGVVRLSADEDVTYGLAIAEGVETALAAPFRPIWACLNAGNMARFPILSGIEALTIFADNDASGTGQRAANECGRRWHDAGREVNITISDTVGNDMADEMEAA